MKLEADDHVSPHMQEILSIAEVIPLQPDDLIAVITPSLLSAMRADFKTDLLHNYRKFLAQGELLLITFWNSF